MEQSTIKVGIAFLILLQFIRQASAGSNEFTFFGMSERFPCHVDICNSNPQTPQFCYEDQQRCKDCADAQIWCFGPRMPPNCTQFCMESLLKESLQLVEESLEKKFLKLEKELHDSRNLLIFVSATLGTLLMIALLVTIVMCTLRCCKKCDKQKNINLSEQENFIDNEKVKDVVQPALLNVKNADQNGTVSKTYDSTSRCSENNKMPVQYVNVEFNLHKDGNINIQKTKRRVEPKNPQDAGNYSNPMQETYV